MDSLIEKNHNLFRIYLHEKQRNESTFKSLIQIQEESLALSVCCMVKDKFVWIPDEKMVWSLIGVNQM
jgi:hypothetical protein